jgi:hypothetical protein
MMEMKVQFESVYQVLGLIPESFGRDSLKTGSVFQFL